MSQDVVTAAPIGVIPEWTLGDRLRKLRRMLGVSQAAFAETLGTNQKTYASWEIDNSAPRHAQMLDVARRAEQATGVPAAWLIGITLPSSDAEPGSVIPFPLDRTRAAQAHAAAAVALQDAG